MPTSLLAADLDAVLLEDGNVALESLFPAFVRGDGCFETFRAPRGLGASLDRHLTRLSWTASRIGLVPPPLDDIDARIDALLSAAACEEGRLRLSLWQGRERVHELLTLHALDPAASERLHRGVDVVTSPFVRAASDPTSGMKLLSRSFLECAQRDARERGAEEALLLGEQGELRECCYANVFLVDSAGVLTTPTIVDAFLPGVTRARLLEAARAGGLEVRERTVHRDEIGPDTELFLTSAIQGITGVRSLDGRPQPMDSGRLDRLLQMLV